jgi:uncharacterized protein YdeI (YjbR/CyaY-like superfamily)
MEREILEFKHQRDFESWIETHYTQSTGVWILIAKKGSGKQSITYAEALDVALCFGWIDGQKSAFDNLTWLQYFSKRKRKSIWSQVNRENIQRLTMAGRMRPSGLMAVEEAKESGQWESAYQPGKSREIPEDLERALNSNEKAKDFFESLDSRNRFSFVFRISTAKKADTRQKRLSEYIRMLENGEVFHPKR